MYEPSTSNLSEWLLDVGLLEPQCSEQGDGWSVWSAQSFQDGINVDRSYLYVTPRCPWAELERAADTIAKCTAGSGYAVLFPTRTAPQLEHRHSDRLGILFPKGNIITLQKLYYSAAVNRNLGAAQSQPVEHFVEQRVSFPGEHEAVPALRTIVQWLRGDIATKQKVAVLLAPGGQGKTTLALELFHHFSTSGYEATIPVLLERTSWEKSREPLSEMEDVWRNGIREWYPDAGMSPEMLRKSLFLGTICPIFDGLDELCTLLPWDFKPDDTLSELISTFAGVFGDGRLLITSRLTFWQDNISPNLLGQVLQLDLQKFSGEERDAYLGKRFPEEEDSKSAAKRDRARRILSRIGSRTATYRASSSDTKEEITGAPKHSRPYEGIELLPFVVMLAADSADTEQSDHAAMYGEMLESADPLKGLLLAICDRDQIRHGLPKELTAESQLHFLEMLVSEFGSPIADEDFELSLLEIGFEPEIKAKFADHCLIRRKGERYVVTYDFVFDYLRVSVLLKWLQATNEKPTPTNILMACAGQPGNLLDGAADLIRSVCGPQWINLAHERFLDSFDNGQSRWNDKCEAGFFHLVLALAKRESQREERIEKLLLVLGDKDRREILGLYLEGAIDNLNLKGVRFRNIRFGDIEFAHCDFDESTELINCAFQERLFVEDSCNGFGHVVCRDCSMTPQVRSTFQRLKVENIDQRITPEQIDDAIVSVLRRFRRGEGYKTCKEDGVRGTARNLHGFGDEIVDTLVEHAVLDRFRHGNLRMLRVNATGDIYQLFHNNYKRGRLKATRDHLVKVLIR